jgi:hypothetical protein
MWLKADGHTEAIAQVVHPHAFIERDTPSDLPEAAWLGLTGADLAVVFTPSGFNSGGRHVCLLVWAIHSAAEEPHCPSVLDQTKRAGRALALLRRDGRASNTAFRGLILRSGFSGDVSDLPSHRVDQDVDVIGARVPADPGIWHGQEGVFSLRYALYECLTTVAAES